MNIRKTSHASSAGAALAAAGRVYVLFIVSLLSAATSTKTILMADALMTLTVRNNVTYTSRPLMVHCFSGDNDIGEKPVAYGGEYAFDFESMLWTKFWCDLKPDSYFHAYFVAWEYGYGDGNDPYYFHASSAGAAGGGVFVLFIVFLLSTETIPMASAAAVTVIVYNNVTYTSRPLLVHCWSSDDDVGGKYVSFGVEYTFDFEPILTGDKKTKYWCNLEPDASWQAYFVAWEHGYFGGDGNIGPYYWYAGDDAVHGRKDYSACDDSYTWEWKHK
ncbi:unnamed protein product [Linum tenue]|uniref:S-protein homolog n=1 Tax=Linum tenue TaxID=586396 RepID=A0AAV0PD28_9ROSI|nr:unnamed protein product [Linum tenue]